MFKKFKWLQSLDLSDFSIEYVEEGKLNKIIDSCDNLEELSISWWNFSNYNASWLMPNLTNWWNASIKKINAANTVFLWDMSNAFGLLTNLNEIILYYNST